MSLENPGDEHLDPSSTPSLQVFVCTYNGAGKIESCLRALAAQTEPVSVIVIDDGSKDDTVEVAQRVGREAKLDLRVVPIGVNGGIWRARQRAIDECDSELIAFVDDDCRPVPTWSATLHSCWRSAPEVLHGVGGPTRAFSPTSLNERYNDVFNTLLPLPLIFAETTSVATRLRLYLKPPGLSNGDLIANFAGANMSFRTASLRAVGGFPSVRGASEDTYICDQIRKRFGRTTLRYCDQAVVEHEYGKNLRDTFRRSAYYGRGAGQLWRQRGGLPSLRPGPVIIKAATVAVALIGILVASLGVAVLSAAGAALVAIYALYGPRSFKGTGELRRNIAERVVLYPLIRTLDEFIQFVTFVVAATKKTGTTTS